MSYLLYDEDGNVTNPKELQNRAIWYQHGESREKSFVALYGDKHEVILNPNKKFDHSAPDLMFKGDLADLKCQETPIFIAGRYGLDPTYAVTFNLKDALNYGRWGNNYERLSIIYWVEWIATKMIMYGKEYRVKKLKGVWHASFQQIDEMRLKSPIHWYRQRNRTLEKNHKQSEILAKFEPRLIEGDNVWSIRGAQDNAACSYIFDLRKLKRLL